MKAPLLVASALLCALAACQSAPETQQALPPAQSATQVRAVLQQSAQDLETSQQQALLSDRPILLVFWQSWCGSCVEEAPQVQRLHQQYGERFPIFGVISGPDEAVDAGHLQQTVFRLGLSYPQIRDRDLSLTKAFQVKGTPDIVVLGKDREVKYRGHHLPASLDVYLD